MARSDYPTGYDADEGCDVCQRSTDDCDCPECPKCASVGDYRCYDRGHMKTAHDSVGAFQDHIGASDDIGQTLRLIDKYNAEHVWLVFREGHPKTGKKRVYYHDRVELDFTPDWIRLEAVGVGGIAWDGSDWEHGVEVVAGDDWSKLDAAREDFHDALADWKATSEDDEE